MAALTDTRQLKACEWRAVEALLAGASLDAAAATAQVSARTLRRWRKFPRFSEALEGAQAHAYEEAIGLLRVSVLDAVRVLREVANDRAVPPANRVSAARALLDNAMRREATRIEASVAMPATFADLMRGAAEPEPEPERTVKPDQIGEILECLESLGAFDAHRAKRLEPGT